MQLQKQVEEIIKAEEGSTRHCQGRGVRGMTNRTPWNSRSVGIEGTSVTSAHDNGLLQYRGRGSTKRSKFNTRHVERHQRDSAKNVNSWDIEVKEHNTKKVMGKMEEVDWK